MTGHSELERFCADAHPHLVGAFAHHFGDRWLAEELAQEALIRVCRDWDRVRHLDAPEGWAFHVGRNLGRSLVRRQRVAHRARRRAAASDVHLDPDTPDRLAVREALGSLTEPQRAVVVLRKLLGVSTAETAALLQISPDAVRARLHRALVRLQDRLDSTSTSTTTAEARDAR